PALLVAARRDEPRRPEARAGHAHALLASREGSRARGRARRRLLRCARVELHGRRRVVPSRRATAAGARVARAGGRTGPAPLRAGAPGAAGDRVTSAGTPPPHLAYVVYWGLTEPLGQSLVLPALELLARALRVTP